VRLSAASALEPHARDPRVPAALIPALLALLRDPVGTDPPGSPDYGPSMTMNAAHLLGRLAPGTASAGEVVAALAEAVRSDEWARRQSAIQALREFGPAAEPAISALVQVVREDLRGDSAAARFEVQSFGSFGVDSAAGVLAMIALGTRPA